MYYGQEQGLTGSGDPVRSFPPTHHLYTKTTGLTDCIDGFD